MLKKISATGHLTGYLYVCDVLVYVVARRNNTKAERWRRRSRISFRFTITVATDAALCRVLMYKFDIIEVDRDSVARLTKEQQTCNNTNEKAPRGGDANTARWL